MKVRSPGPLRYSGSAMDSKKQEQVDSTRRWPWSFQEPFHTPMGGILRPWPARNKSFSCSFGVGPRWKGPVSEMALSGALARYDRPCL